MSYTIKSTDPIFTWGVYDICLLFENDNGVGLNQISLLSSPTKQNQWTQIGSSGGLIWVQANNQMTWEQEVADKGGFKIWWASIINIINARLAVWAANINPSASVGSPSNFLNFSISAKNNIVFSDGGSQPIVAAK